MPTPSSAVAARRAVTPPPSASSDVSSSAPSVVLPHGEKATMSDVARAAGVSTTAVSYAISGKGRMPETTRKAILETARQMGYEANYYAQRIRGGCSNTIAFFSSNIAGVASEKLGRIQQEMISRGFSTPLHGFGLATPQEQAEAVKQLRRQRPRAIIASGLIHELVLKELYRFQNEDGIVMCYDQTYPVEIEQVNLDRELGAYHATRHLLEQGHRDIGISIHNHAQAETDQTRGFRRALNEAGVPFQNQWYCPAYPFESAGKALAMQFLAMPKRPTAFYIVDDRVAMTFVHYVLRSGLQIPQDVSVVTHDQASVAEHCLVPLTVVNHPTSQIVSSVLTMALSRIEGEYNGPTRHVVISGQLVERESVRALAR